MGKLANYSEKANLKGITQTPPVAAPLTNTGQILEMDIQVLKRP
jgi:hypothetical protein